MQLWSSLQTLGGNTALLWPLRSHDELRVLLGSSLVQNFSWRWNKEQTAIFLLVETQEASEVDWREETIRADSDSDSGLLLIRHRVTGPFVYTPACLLPPTRFSHTSLWLLLKSPDRCRCQTHSLTVVFLYFVFHMWINIQTMDAILWKSMHYCILFFFLNNYDLLIVFHK